jgi:hypothetical protein
MKRNNPDRIISQNAKNVNYGESNLILDRLTAKGDVKNAWNKKKNKQLMIMTTTSPQSTTILTLLPKKISL